MFSIRDSWAHLLALNILILTVYTIYGVIYRLYLSPIAKFPGPKLAGLTFWYEFYYDVIKRGKYTFKIGELHKQYGPIIRINPYELHVYDPDFYSILYSGPSQRRDKWEWSAKMFGISKSVFSTVPHDHHRLRQKALLPFFSKRSVDHLEPLIQSTVDGLCVNMKKHEIQQQPVNLIYAFSAVSTDVICQYAFGKSYHNIDREDFAPEWYHALMDPSELSLTLKQFGWIFGFMRATPKWIVKRTNKLLYSLLMLQKEYADQVQEILDGKAEPSDDEQRSRTIFHEILRSDLPAQEKTKERMIDEAQTIVAAGTVTITHMLSVTVFHILDNPHVAQKLKEELHAATIPSRSIPLAQLQKLPYLTAIIREGFRMGYGVSHRLQRIKPDGSLPFHHWLIPAGTPVSMSSVFMHDNPTIFPQPHEFRPERWLGDGVRLEKYLVPFSRGTRACIGINLAYAEMYLTLATVFRRFDLELFETTRADVDLAHDFFNACPRLDSKGVRVMAKSTALRE